MVSIPRTHTGITPEHGYETGTLNLSQEGRLLRIPDSTYSLLSPLEKLQPPWEIGRTYTKPGLRPVVTHSCLAQGQSGLGSQPCQFMLLYPCDLYAQLLFAPMGSTVRTRSSAAPFAAPPRSWI